MAKDNRYKISLWHSEHRLTPKDITVYLPDDAQAVERAKTELRRWRNKHTGTKYDRWLVSHITNPKSLGRPVDNGGIDEQETPSLASYYDRPRTTGQRQPGGFSRPFVPPS